VRCVDLVGTVDLSAFSFFGEDGACARFLSNATALCTLLETAADTSSDSGSHLQDRKPEVAEISPETLKTSKIMVCLM
jgi:hypothetical protein